MGEVVEHIPDTDVVCRLVEEPFMYQEDKHLIWDNVFQFPTHKQTNEPNPESVVWTRHAPEPDGVHTVGSKREALKRLQKPNFAYRGYLRSEVSRIREINSPRGNGFTVEHVPAEGEHHAHIAYRVQRDLKLQKAEKGDLRLLLGKAFSQLVPRTDIDRCGAAET